MSGLKKKMKNEKLKNYKIINVNVNHSFAFVFL